MFEAKKKHLQIKRSDLIGPNCFTHEEVVRRFLYHFHFGWHMLINKWTVCSVWSILRGSCHLLCQQSLKITQLSRKLCWACQARGGQNEGQEFDANYSGGGRGGHGFLRRVYVCSEKLLVSTRRSLPPSLKTFPNHATKFYSALSFRHHFSKAWQYHIQTVIQPCMWFMEEPTQFSVGQTALSSPSWISHIQGWMTLNVLLPCSRKRMSALLIP